MKYTQRSIGKEEAIRLANSKWWETKTDTQVVTFQLFTEELCIDFPILHEKIEKVLGRPVFTHEFANYDNLISELMGDKAPPSLDDIMNLIPEDKRLVVVQDSNSFCRSQEDILARINQLKDTDFFGHQISDLVDFLEYENAKPFLKPDTTKEQWDATSSDRDTILKRMEEYMDFAWEKANDRRGLSAGRSMDHYSAWVWMLGDQDKFGDLGDYEYYGKDNLKKICDTYGWDSSKWDDGVREN